MVLSIRNVSRFGYPLLAVAWFVSFIIGVGVFGQRFFGMAFLWFLIGAATVFLFRCPRCRASSITMGGNLLWGAAYAPFWTPRSCPKCGLDFRDKTFWSTGNRRLRSDWLLLTKATRGGGS